MAWGLQDDHTGMLGRESGLHGSPFQFYHQQMAQQQMIDLVRQANIRQATPYINAAQSLLAGSGQSLTPEMAYAMQTAGGIAASRGWLGGGSSGDLMQGIFQAVGGGGFKIRGEGLGAAARLHGQGGLTGYFSQQIHSSMEDHFFGNTAGAQLHRTHGLDRTEMGSIVNQLQQRGAFSGMEIGTLGMGSDGGVVPKIPDFTKRRIAEFVEDAAGTIGTLREIFGDQSMDKLMSEAERVSGMTFRGEGSAKAIKSRMDGIKIQAAMFGMDATSYAWMDTGVSANTAAYIAQRTGADIHSVTGFTSAMTPSITMEANTRYQNNLDEANRLAREEGKIFEVRSREDIMDFQSQAVAQLATQERSMLAAYYAADSYGISDGGRKQLNRLRSNLANARTPEEQQAARDAMQSFMKKEMDVDINTMGQHMSFEELNLGISSGTKAEFGNVYKNMERNISVSSFQDISSQLGSGISGEGLHKFFSSFGMESSGKLLNFLESGVAVGKDGKTISSLEEFMEFNDLEGLGMSGTDIRQVLKDGGPNAVRDLKRARAQVRTREDLTSFTSREDDRNNLRSQAAEILKENALGEGQAKLGLLDLLGQGIGGKVDVTNEKLLAWGRENSPEAIASLAFNAQGGLSANEAQQKRLQQVLASADLDIASIMGTDSVEEAFKQLETQEGLGRFLQATSSSELTLGTEIEGGREKGIQLGATSLQSGKEAIEEEARKARAMTMLGFDLNASGEKKYEAWLSENDKTTSGTDAKSFAEKLMNDPDRVLELIEGMGKDPESKQSQAFKGFVEEQSSSLIPLLSNKEKELRQQAEEAEGPLGFQTKKSKELTSTADKIKDMKDTLIQSGGNKYVGYMATDQGHGYQIWNTDGQGKTPLDRPA